MAGMDAAGATGAGSGGQRAGSSGAAGSGSGSTGAAAGSFGSRLAGAMDRLGPLCVGIDPHASLLDAWGLEDSVEGLRRFSLTVANTLAGQVAAIKPQVSFFERHGSQGMAVLEEVSAVVRGSGSMLITDAKRGDIGSTNQGYADAYLREGSPLACDAVTISPYLGFGSLEPMISAARASGRGVFVLCLTSNPQGAALQHAVMADGRSVAASIAQQASVLNAAEISQAGSPPRGSSVGAGSVSMGSVGLVVGATIGRGAVDSGTNLEAVAGPLLAPGVGAQGGGPAELRQVFGAARSQVLASTSRAVLAAGPQAQDIADAAHRAIDQAASALRP